jgi:hypothetical protein
MIFPNMIPRLPPTSSGVTYSPTVGMNTMKKAARTPGKLSGKMIVQKRRQEVAPRSAATSTSSGCMRCKAALMGKAAKGTHT